MPSRSPRRPEPNMRQANTSPRKQRTQPANRIKPVEHDIRAGGEVDIADAPEEERDDQPDERSALSVDVGEEFRGLAVGCECAEGAGGSECGGVADREDGD